jgi:formylglycine-generating enzyme required for sulfatase activity
MASVTGGTFTMGQRKDTVTVQPFLTDVTEVTVDAYAACVGAGGCTADHPGQWTTDNMTFLADDKCNYGVAGRGSHPMNCVDWNQAVAYCGWAKKRLPTEEEWEWAARGQSRGTAYPWGNDAPSSLAWWNRRACWNRKDGTCAVGSYPAGDAPGGIHDLAGNVSEWTASNYDAAGSARVFRGGNWENADASILRASFRPGSPAWFRYYTVGFRCSRTP